MKSLNNCKELVSKPEESRKKTSKVKRVLCAAAIAVSAMSAMALPCHAMDIGMTLTADKAVQEIADGVSPFTEPSVILLCAVSGIKLGMRLLKGSTH